MALKHFGAKHFGARTFTTGFGAGWFQFAGKALGALYLTIIRRRVRR
jgi:hypothetical protein